MNLKEVGSYWTKRKRDLRKLFRSLADFEKQHFSPRRKQLQKLEVDMIKVKEAIKADKILFQKARQMSQGAKGVWRRIRSQESRLESLRASITKRKDCLSKLQRKYKTELHDYRGMAQVVNNRLKHQPSPEFTSTLSPQPEIKAIQRDRRSPDNGLDMDL